MVQAIGRQTGGRKIAGGAASEAGVGAAKTRSAKRVAKPAADDAARSTRRAAGQARSDVKPAPAKEGKARVAEKEAKPKKAKLVRDSFTMPQKEYAVLGALKERLLAAGVAVKKSELLRAGVALLASLAERELKLAVASVEVIKTGRPAKSRG